MIKLDIIMITIWAILAFLVILFIVLYFVSSGTFVEIEKVCYSSHQENQIIITPILTGYVGSAPMFTYIPITHTITVCDDYG